MATIKDVANAAGVSPATVSAVLNDSAFVSAALKARVLDAVRDLDYAPSQLARNLRRGHSELIAIVVADLSNPFYSRVVCAAEAAVSAWGYSLVVFNSDEKPDVEKRILARVRALQCEGLSAGPVGDVILGFRREFGEPILPTVLFGRTLDDEQLDAVTIDNFSASYQATSYLIDLGHRRIGAILGPSRLSTGRDRAGGMQAALTAKGLTLEPRFVRSGEFREEVAYSAARDLFLEPVRPTALYVANGADGARRHARHRRSRTALSRGRLHRLDRQYSGHPRLEAKPDALRTSDCRDGQRVGPPPHGPDQARRYHPAAKGRLSLRARGGRQLCSACGPVRRHRARHDLWSTSHGRFDGDFAPEIATDKGQIEAVDQAMNRPQGRRRHHSLHRRPEAVSGGERGTTRALHSARRLRRAEAMQNLAHRARAPVA